MGVHTTNKELLKKIFNQLSGIFEDGDEIIPEVAIGGSGHIWCYDPTARSVVRVPRGIKCFILDETHDDLGRILVYTVANHVILIEEEELIYTGFD